MARTPSIHEVDAPPEADRLDGFSHPRETTVLFGHEAAEALLLDALAKERIHQAWLLSGQEGIGKATLAYRLARYILARPEQRDVSGRSLDIADTAAATRQVTALSHPGLLVLRRPYDARSKRFAATIPVDEVRRLRSFLGLTSADSGWRVIIVDSADELNVSASNALLKSLEEPPQRALFLLISSRPSNTLTTIRSRTCRLDLAPLGEAPLREATERVLMAAGLDFPNPAAWDRLQKLAGGSVRRALQLLAGDGLEFYDQVEAIFSYLPKINWPELHAFADQFSFGPPDQRFDAFYDILTSYLARLVRVRTTERGETAEYALAQRVIMPERVPDWAVLWERLVHNRSDTSELNLDRKALIVDAVARLGNLARG